MCSRGFARLDSSFAIANDGRRADVIKIRPAAAGRGEKVEAAGVEPSARYLPVTQIIVVTQSTVFERQAPPKVLSPTYPQPFIASLPRGGGIRSRRLNFRRREFTRTLRLSRSREWSAKIWSSLKKNCWIHREPLLKAIVLTVREPSSFIENSAYFGGPLSRTVRKRSRHTSQIFPTLLARDSPTSSTMRRVVTPSPTHTTSHPTLPS
jgi:hypothetical protein